MLSVFSPVGHYPDGYWCEKTGNIQMHLGVNVIDGGWHWVQRKLLIRGITIPAVLYPQTLAYKKIVDGKYEFAVQLTYGKLGLLVGYSGILEATVV